MCLDENELWPQCNLQHYLTKTFLKEGKCYSALHPEWFPFFQSWTSHIRTGCSPDTRFLVRHFNQWYLLCVIAYTDWDLENVEEGQRDICRELQTGHASALTVHLIHIWKGKDQNSWRQRIFESLYRICTVKSIKWKQYDFTEVYIPGKCSLPS